MENREKFVKYKVSNNQIDEKLTKEQVVQLFEAHDLLGKMIKYNKISLDGLFNFETVGDLEKKCNSLLDNIKGNFMEEKITEVVKKVLEKAKNIGGDYKKVKLHDAVFCVTVDDNVQNMKLKCFARDEFGKVMSFIDKKSINLDENIKNYGLEKKYLKKLAEIKCSSQRENCSYKNSSNTQNNINQKENQK